MFDDKKNPRAFLDDAAGMIGGVAGIVADMKGQIRNDMRSRAKDFADKAELAGLNDIERLESMIADISKRLDAVEKAVNKPAKPAAKKNNASAKKTS